GSDDAAGVDAITTDWAAGSGGGGERGRGGDAGDSVSVDEAKEVSDVRSGEGAAVGHALVVGSAGQGSWVHGQEIAARTGKKAIQERVVVVSGTDRMETCKKQCRMEGCVAQRIEGH